ncbi:hypothetical protein H4582DRAFT_2042989 [Lactarius indigo]|nr:hypothetical protein H4582DRAFT_2042989 [Lactarius indigo]
MIVRSGTLRLDNCIAPRWCLRADMPTPTELVETTLHSMIGHYNLFLGGVLHKDVSSGNILPLREPINRFPGLSMNLLGLPEQDVKLCRGFLVDGDHAIERRKDATTPSLERSVCCNVFHETLIGSVNDGDGINTSDSQKRILGELDERCGKVYKEFIQLGYRHLQTIRKFSNWRDVMDFNGELLNK